MFSRASDSFDASFSSSRASARKSSVEDKIVIPKEKSRVYQRSWPRIFSLGTYGSICIFTSCGIIKNKDNHCNLTNALCNTPATEILRIESRSLAEHDGVSFVLLSWPVFFALNRVGV